MTRASKQLARSTSRRSEILHRAADCFFENGFQRTTLRDIAKACGTSVGQIYYYFRNKDEIIEKIVEEYTTDFVDYLTDQNKTDWTDEVAGRERLGQTVDYFLNSQSGRFALMIMHESLQKEPLHKQLQECGQRIRRHLTEQCFPKRHDDLPEVDVYARISILCSLLEGLRISSVYMVPEQRARTREAAVECLYTLIKSGY